MKHIKDSAIHMNLLSVIMAAERPVGDLVTVVKFFLGWNHEMKVETEITITYLLPCTHTANFICWATHSELIIFKMIIKENK
jgi:hypothetical protein